MKRAASFLLSIFALGCSDSQAPNNPPPGGGPTTDVASVTVTPGNRAVLVRSHLAFQAVVIDTLGRELTDETIAWSVSNTASGMIDAAGLASFFTPGTQRVDATVDGVTGSATMQVEEVTWAMLDAGRGHTCGLTTEGVAWCWGYSARGQVGYGGNADQFAPIRVATDLRFAMIESGGWTTCALTSAGAAYCWGEENGTGYVDGTVSDAFAPAPVSGGLTFTDLAVGGTHACGLTASGDAWCWGYGIHGQLGNGGMVSSRVPVAVDQSVAFQQLTAGWEHTCGIANDGSAWCWGANQRGQVGTEAPNEICEPGTFPESLCHTRPARVASEESFVAITGGIVHTCAIATGGAAWCWGSNEGGELGTGATGAPEPVPVAVADGHAFTTISAGYWASTGSAGYTCATNEAGAAYCWGENREGRLGTGGTQDETRPAAVVSALSFAGISAGQDHTCAVTGDGVGYCWGTSGAGALGTMPGFVQSLVPGRVPGKRE